MWLDQVARPTLRPKTIEGHETVILRHLLPRIGAKTLRSLTTSDVRALMAGMTKQGLAPRTVQYVHAVVRTASAQAPTGRCRRPTSLNVVYDTYRRFSQPVEALFGSGSGG